MALMGDVFRPFWLPGLHEIAGSPRKEISGWLCDEQYQIYSPPTHRDFSLFVYDLQPLAGAYASEISRIAIAAFETVHEVQSSSDTAGIAWALIKKYYAAFFASHVLMRCVGDGCNTLGRDQITCISRVAQAWGATEAVRFPTGLYRFHYNRASTEFIGHTIGGSPHESFWHMFDTKLTEIRDDLLSRDSSAVLDEISKQQAALKLGQLKDNLSYLKQVRQASWLTSIRNSINYDHQWATWWPYSERPKYYSQLRSASGSWRSDAMSIDLIGYEGEDILRFQATCNFLLASCRETIQEMAARCPDGKSFHNMGVLAYLRQVKLLKNKTGPV